MVAGLGFLFLSVDDDSSRIKSLSFNITASNALESSQSTMAPNHSQIGYSFLFAWCILVAMVTRYGMMGPNGSELIWISMPFLTSDLGANTHVSTYWWGCPETVAQQSCGAAFNQTPTIDYAKKTVVHIRLSVCFLDLNFLLCCNVL